MCVLINKNMMTGTGKNIDEGLYSRQLYVLGHEAMKKMAQSNILIIGLGSLGVEVAKNVILSGVLSVTLHDNKNTEFNDLSGQFYLSEQDVGKNRAECCLNRLRELNSYVTVNCSKEELTGEYLSNFSVVAFCLTENYKTLVQINNLCRQVGTKFIWGQSMGLCGRVFSDFGDSFTVHDNDGEQIKSGLVQDIVVGDNKLIISSVETKPHDLQKDQYVKFHDIDGLTETYKVTQILDRHRFVCEYGELIKYISGQTCMFEQVKMPVQISFKNLDESLKEPDFMFCDLSNFEKPQILHECFQLLNTFIARKGRFPKPYSPKDYELFIDKNAGSSIYKQFCYTCTGNLCPTSAVLGGIMAQEVMKACSGKFMPIKQFLYFDAFECLGKDWEMNENKIIVEQNRYAGQVAVFGKQFQEQLGNKKWFMVGSGAIGCELLKNFAMIGLCCGDQGRLTITDMDIIEKSNLNRQFLFRDKNIGQLKSEAAAIAVKGMNKDINIIPHQNKVGKDTEHVYNDNFFNELDGVANALDNVQARLYVDEKCVYYGKPLLESGTLGTKGNVQVIVPNITESYGSTQDPPEQSVPVCTLKNFPNQIEHTIQYARDQFEGLFTSTPENLKQYIENPTYLEEMKKNSPQDLYSVLNDLNKICRTIPKEFIDCVEWARLFFESQYNNQIQQLLHNFPKNHKTKSGALFWSGSKRCPKPIIFNPENRQHMDYILAGSNLMAQIFDILGQTNTEIIKEMLDQITVPTFTPKSGIKISANDKEEKEMEEMEKNNGDVDQMINDLPKLTNLVVSPLEFEKDDDTNFHMDFITAASNLRAINYGIKPVDKHKTKGIAGKIIPAIATTTAVVSGLVTLELYKLCQGLNDITSYRDTFLNLALPLVTISEPKPCKKEKYLDNEFSLWDFIEIKGDMTLEKFIELCQNKYNFEIDMITFGNSMLYAFYQPPTKVAKKMNMLMTELVKSVSDEDISLKKSLLLHVGTHDPEDEEQDMEVPPIKLFIGKEHVQNVLQSTLSV